MLEIKILDPTGKDAVDSCRDENNTEKTFWFKKKKNGGNVGNERHRAISFLGLDVGKDLDERPAKLGTKM